MVVCAIVFLIWWSLYSILFQGPVEAARGLRQEAAQSGRDFWEGLKSGLGDSYDGLKQVVGDASRFLQFTPQITVNNTVVIEAHKPILELATIQREQVEKYRFEHSFLGSKKVFELEARVRVKAGFDLKKNYAIDFDTVNRRVTAQFAPAQILSVEVLNYKIVADQDGWWNKITPEERQEALNSLRRQAWKNALQTGILKEAENEMAKQLNDVMKSREPTLQFDMIYKKD